MVRAFSQGDILVLDFSPQSGHEQAGRRPALVVSNDLFNRSTNMTMVCPITRTDRGYPFHVPLDSSTQTQGFILCEQARMLDLSSRNARVKERAPAEIVAEVVDILIGFVEIDE